MKVYLVDRLESIGKTTWNGLVSGSRSSSVFQTYEWHAAWWEAYGEGKQPFLVCVSEADRAVAIAPLMVCREPGGKRVLRFIGHGRSDYLDFIYTGGADGVLDEVFRFLHAASDRWDEIDLKYLPSDSPSYKAIPDACRRSGLYSVLTDTIECPTLHLKGDPERVREVVGKKSVRRDKKYFLKRPGYKVLHIRDSAEVMKYVDRFFDQHVERWSKTHTPSLFTDPRNRSFYRGLVSAMEGTDYLAFSVLESEGSPAAFHFGFSYAGRFVYYKPSFDISLLKRSPGKVLMSELIDFALASGFDEFDFAVGDETYKTRFASDIRYNFSYVVVKTLPGLYLQRARRSLRQLVRRSGTLQSALNRWRRLKGSSGPGS
jgi:CelD/BcsL family acetyltransferase involved in cellulose biosynthesis